VLKRKAAGNILRDGHKHLTREKRFAEGRRQKVGPMGALVRGSRFSVRRSWGTQTYGLARISAK
jgi:hypothetical protein